MMATAAPAPPATSRTARPHRSDVGAPASSPRERAPRPPARIPFPRLGLDCRGASSLLLTAEAFKERHQFVTAVAVTATELDEVLHHLDDLGPLRRPGDADHPPVTDFEQSLVTELAQRSKDGVCVHAEHRRQVLRLRDPLTRFRFTVGDGSSDLDCDLLVKKDRVVSVYRGKLESGFVNVARSLDFITLISIALIASPYIAFVTGRSAFLVHDQPLS